MKDPFALFIEKCYVEWQASNKRRQSIKNFAAYIGVSRVLVSSWMNGTRKPGPENTKRLAQLFGLEVYDALGLDRPDPDLFFITEVWPELPADIQRQIMEQLKFYKHKEI